MMEYIPPPSPSLSYTYPQADSIPDSFLQVQLDHPARASPRFNFFTKSTLSPTEPAVYKQREQNKSCLPAALPCPDMAAHTQPPQPDDPLAALLLPLPLLGTFMNKNVNLAKKKLGFQGQTQCTLPPKGPYWKKYISKFSMICGGV